MSKVHRTGTAAPRTVTRAGGGGETAASKHICVNCGVVNILYSEYAVLLTTYPAVQLNPFLSFCVVIRADSKLSVNYVVAQNADM